MKQKPGKAPSKKYPATGSKSVIKKEKHRTYKGWYILLSLLLIVVVTFFTYRASVINKNFTNWDDNEYVLDNNRVKTLNWEHTGYFFTHPSASNYHPLTMISLSLDYYFTMKKKKPFTVNDEPDGRLFHTTNLILHLLNTILVFLFIYLLFRRKIVIALITAIFFGIHPLHVESVGWIAERKDVLYTFFFLAGLIFYLQYSKGLKLKYYLLSAIAFILSLLSKPAAVAFPLLLFAIDFYIYRKISSRLILEKIPFFLLAILIGLITMFVQTKSLAPIHAFSIFQRFLFASYGFIMYIYKLILPLHLSAFYPYPFLTATGYLPVIFYLSPIIVLCILGLIILSVHYTRVISFGFAFYFICIALVLQFIMVGSAIIADRYTYVPSIGLFFIIGYYSDWVLNQKTRIFKLLRPVMIITLLIYSVFLIHLSILRTRIWENSGTLMTDIIEQYPASAIFYKNRGNYYAMNNQSDLALKDYETLIHLNPKDALGYSNLGNIYGLRGEFDKSLDAYSKSVALDSNNFEAYLNRGITYAKQRKFEPAAKDFEKALKLNPGSISVYQNCSYAYLEMGQIEKALNAYNILITQFPENDDYFLKRGICKFQQKKYDESLDDFLHCLSLNPNNSFADFNISVTYNIKKEYKNAINYAMKAKVLGYNVTQDYLNELRKNQK